MVSSSIMPRCRSVTPVASLLLESFTWSWLVVAAVFVLVTSSPPTVDAWVATPTALKSCWFKESTNNNDDQRKVHTTAFRNLLQGGSQPRTRSTTSSSVLFARRNKRAQMRKDEADLNRWYDAVDAGASPDDVFWEEMERQRLLAKVGGSTNGAGSGPSAGDTSAGGASYADMMDSASTQSAPSSMSASSVSRQSLAKTNSLLTMAAMNGQTQKSAEATLSEYAAFAVSDNWLDEELAWMMMDDSAFYMEGDDDYVKSLDEQLDEWEALEDSDDADDEIEVDMAWMQSDDPWDHWSADNNLKAKDDSSPVTQKKRIDPQNRAASFLLQPTDDRVTFDDEDEELLAEEARRAEAEHVERLSKLMTSSRQLERARNNPRAKAFFSRPPDALEGYDRLWVSAIDNVCYKNLVGIFRDYGIEFADNFGDWQDGCLEDSMAPVEDVASFKARQVYNVTGLPCIASRTSFEIEPIPTNMNTGTPGGGRAMVQSPRVTSGYHFNDIGLHVDYICDALRPISEPHRVTRFTTCLCYYDGEMEIFDYGICDVDLYFSNSMRTFIPVAQAINEMVKKLQLTFGLEHQRWLKARVDEASSVSSQMLGTASVKLRDRVLKEGKVLPNEIIDVSAFMDSKVDVNLMDECAKELSNRFLKEKPSKILTVATTGLVIALPMAKYLQVPVVYARKERNVVMADTFKAGYSSKTVGLGRELLVSKSHLHSSDRVLIVDDFLSSGSSQEALLRIVAESGATAVGVGVLLEKVYDSGRQSLSGFDIPIQSLCRIASVKGGVIQLQEEAGFDRMQRKSPAQGEPPSASGSESKSEGELMETQTSET